MCFTTHGVSDQSRTMAHAPARSLGSSSCHRHQLHDTQVPLLLPLLLLVIVLVLLLLMVVLLLLVAILAHTQTLLVSSPMFVLEA